MRDGDEMEAQPSKATGRPSSYTPEMALKICELMAEGKSLRRICEDPEMPARKTVNTWKHTFPEFRAQYARAREERADWYADEIIEIADQTTALEAAAARLQIDARKWAASKMAPKVYGDKLDQTTTLEAGASFASLLTKITTDVLPAHALEDGAAEGVDE